MITTARPLKVKDILKSKKSNHEKTIWCGVNQSEILTHRSWNSLSLIMQWYNENNGRKPVVFVPKFYCYDTLFQLKDLVDFVYYDINEEFIPDYKQCNVLSQDVKADIFIFVHYFGNNLDPNDAKVFCKNQGALLIEDAVHVLFGEGKTGKYGDFTIYSPWKTCGLPDGAVLLMNDKGPNNLNTHEIKQQFEKLNNHYIEYPQSAIAVWKIKKLLQKVLPNRKCEYREVEKQKFESENNYRISSYSKNALLELRQEDIYRMSDSRRMNEMVLEDCLRNRYHFQSMNKNGTPYAAAIRATEDYRNIWRDAATMGEVVFTWPDLAPSLEKDEPVFQLKKQLLHIAVHDGISPAYINTKTENNDDEELVINRISVEEYRELCDKATKPLPILQSEGYASAKSETQSWKVAYWIVKSGTDVVAFFLTLNKYGLVYRINRGPYFIDDSDRQKVYFAIRSKFGKRGHVLFFAPEEKQTGANINMLLNQGYRYRNSYFSTGFIDLKEDEELLRKKMDSKWRNQLRGCEKLKLSVCKADSEEIFQQLLSFHEDDKENRSYRDSGNDITKYLYNNGQLMSFYVRGDSDEVMSLVMIVTHNRTATYYIGWSNKEGYRKNANRFLLWEAIKYLKKNGYEWFDLGGIDMVNTRSIAEFKLGIGCSYVDLAGEYFSF
jgi:hypothetical protein